MWKIVERIVMRKVGPRTRTSSSESCFTSSGPSGPSGPSSATCDRPKAPRRVWGSTRSTSTSSRSLCLGRERQRSVESLAENGRDISSCFSCDISLWFSRLLCQGVSQDSFEPGRLTCWFLSSTQQKVLPLPLRQWYVLMGCYGAMGSYGCHMVSSCKKYNFERKVTKWLFLLVFPPTNFYFSSCSWKRFCSAWNSAWSETQVPLQVFFVLLLWLIAGLYAENVA